MRVDVLAAMFYFVILNVMPGIGVITNPKAKKNRTRPWMREKLQHIVGDAGRVYETRSIAELPQVAEEFIERDLDVLVVNGGDGTTHVALSHFIPIYGDRPLPKLLSLRGGTMNTISNAIRHKGNSEDILASVVSKVREGKPLDIVLQPALKINNLYGFMFGFGVVGNFMEAYYKGPSLGPWQAARVVLHYIGSSIIRSDYAKNMFSATPTRLNADGQIFELPECRAVLVSAIREMGLGAMLGYRCYEKLGYIHVRTTELKAHQFVAQVPKFFLGKPTDPDKILDELYKEIVAETKGFPPYTIDGELYRDTNIFRVSQGPIIRFIREGAKKVPKGIGLMGDEVKALTERSSIKKDNSDDQRRGFIETGPSLHPFAMMA